MIPTTFKAKLPGRLTWPIGAESISAGLAAAEQVERFELWFSGQAVWPALEFQRLVREGLPYRILAIKFEPARHPGLSASNFLIDDGWYDEHWEITVYPVLRDQRHAANERLREQGLPAALEWLASARQPGWLNRRHTFELVFHPADGKLTTATVDGV